MIFSTLRFHEMILCRSLKCGQTFDAAVAVKARRKSLTSQWVRRRRRAKWNGVRVSCGHYDVSMFCSQDMEYRLFGRSSVPKGRKEHLVPAKCSRGCWNLFKSILETGWDRQSLPFLVLCQILSTMTEVLLKNGDNPTSFQTKSFWDKSTCIRRHHSNQKRRPSVWPVPQTTVNLTRAIHFWPAPCTLKHWGLRSLLIC